jgi:DNA-binding LacI/PurR family transcriptional regulator
MGLDDVEISTMTHPTLTTLAQPVREMVEKAVDMILNYQDYASVAPRGAVLEPSLIVRESTGMAMNHRASR